MRKLKGQDRFPEMPEQGKSRNKKKIWHLSQTYWIMQVFVGTSLDKVICLLNICASGLLHLLLETVIHRHPWVISKETIYVISISFSYQDISLEFWEIAVGRVTIFTSLHMFLGFSTKMLPSTSITFFIKPAPFWPFWSSNVHCFQGAHAHRNHHHHHCCFHFFIPSFLYLWHVQRSPGLWQPHF